MTATRVRVAHVGTGHTGTVTLRGIIDDPALDLVALKVSSPAKVGGDAGELCGRPPSGVLATDDEDAVVAAQPDCVAYCASAVRREADAIADIARYLAAGIDVVAISVIPMVYPPAADPGHHRLLESACDEGGSTFYATGCEPGFVSLNVPTALLAGAGVVDSYRMDEYALDLDLTYPLWDVLHESMGFGKPDGHVPARIASGTVRQDWEPVVRYLADVLGAALDDIELDWETVIAPTDLTTALGVIPAGTVCAHRWQLAGVIARRSVVAVQYFATVTSTPWPQRWPRRGREGGGGMVFRIEGRPTMTVDLQMSSPPGDPVSAGVAATAMAAVNAIPAVVAAAPGVLPGPLAGPAIVTRQFRRGDGR